MPEWKKLCWDDLACSSFVLNQNSLRVTIPVHDVCDCSDVCAHLGTVLWAASIGFLGFYIRWELCGLSPLCGPPRVVSFT